MKTATKDSTKKLDVTSGSCLNEKLLKKLLLIFGLLLMLSPLVGCTKNSAEIGSEGNPIKFFLVPSVDAKTLTDRSVVLEKYLAEHTPYKYKFAIPASYVAVVEAFGTKRADVASLATFGYIMAHDKHGVEAKITVVRFGADTYKAQIVARTDGPVKKVEDITGKKFAFVDPASTSGYLLPAKLFADKGIKPSETVFAQKHDNVITMVYQGQVAAGATFYTEPEKGVIQDARRLVKTQFPDVEKKVKIVELTDPIPNDPFVFRKDLPEEVKEKIITALLDFAKTEEGKKVLYDLYGITDLKRSSDATYDSVRALLTKLGTSANQLVK
ncbi:MAG: phosphate/phosphite/phosphonate ABC transporter substrate-binding protein [Bdellovibrionales bacterium]